VADDVADVDRDKSLEGLDDGSWTLSILLVELEELLLQELTGRGPYR
jgi:hypothetical protein